MAGYLASVREFINTPSSDLLRYLTELQPYAPLAQIRSWEVLIDDLKHTDALLQLPETVLIGLEFPLLAENRSADLILAGMSAESEPLLWIIEAKQWGDDYIQTYHFSRYREDEVLLHPQIQVQHHVLAFRHYLQTEPTFSKIIPAVYMRNATQEACADLCRRNPDPSSAWIPITNDLNALLAEIAEVLVCTPALPITTLEKAIYRPSRGMIEAMHTVVTQEEPFLLTQEQEAAVKQILHLFHSGKRIIQISGGAGSGKTAVLLHLYLYLAKQVPQTLPLFVSGAQNTHLYKSLYPSAEDAFMFSYSVPKALFSVQNRTPVVLLDEAQHNHAGVLSDILSHPSAIMIFCYDEWQVIHADNALKEIAAFQKREDFASVRLSRSVRFNGSQQFESNIKAYLSLAKIPPPDEAYDFRVLSSLEEVKRQTHLLIHDHPNEEVALIGLLSDTAAETVRQANGFMHLDWTSKSETKWIPYIRSKQYLSHCNGSLWVGTWWLPGLDVDYTVVLIGDDAVLTQQGLKGIPQHSKNYNMMLGIAAQLGIPSHVTDPYTAKFQKANAVLQYLNLPQNRTLKEAFQEQFDLCLRNMYYIMMTRGRKGCMVYFKNQKS